MEGSTARTGNTAATSRTLDPSTTLPRIKVRLVYDYGSHCGTTITIFTEPIYAKSFLTLFSAKKI